MRVINQKLILAWLLIMVSRFSMIARQNITSKYYITILIIIDLLCNCFLGYLAATLNKKDFNK